MKVGLVCFHSFANPGGVKAHVLGLYNEYKKRGIKVKIIVPRRNLGEKYGKDVILLGTSLPLKIGGTQADLDVNFNPFAIDQLFKKEKFDVLHFHNFSFPSGYQILEKSKALNIMTFHANLEKVKLFKFFPFIISLFNKEVKDEIDGIIGVNPSFNNVSKAKLIKANSKEAASLLIKPNLVPATFAALFTSIKSNFSPKVR